jgi:ankyrin repeat protein
VKVVCVLLSAGAVVEARDQVSAVRNDQCRLICLQKERTPLHIACCEGHVKMVSVLFEAGADVFSQDEVMISEARRV